MSRFHKNCSETNLALWQEFVIAHRKHYNTPPYGLWEESTVRQTMELFRNKSS